METNTFQDSSKKEWEHGLCNCCSNLGTCALGYFCPCYVQGKNVEAIGGSCLLGAISLWVPFLNIYCLCKNRKEVREKAGIEVCIILY